VLRQLSAPNTPNQAANTDVYGITSVALDPTGYSMVVSRDPDKLGTKLTVDDPYEAKTMAGVGAGDMAFSVAEMETLLRQHDHDASQLPDRLLRFAQHHSSSTGSSSSSQQLRRLFTTHSVHIPASHQMIAVEKNASGMPINHLTDLMVKRLNGNLSDSAIAQQLRAMLSPELIGGYALDINRPFGNGRDDNGNGVIDEPMEANMAQGESIWQDSTGDGSPSHVPADFRSIDFAHTNDDLFIDDLAYARQIYARHLFFLMMLLTEPKLLQVTESPTPAELFDRERAVHRIAQWSINAVDFRDPGAIMSAFEFDVNPFNGWQDEIDGDVGTNEGGDRRVVWGCEYPEMLITETLAYHNRRVRDTDNDDGPSETRKEGDPNLDQFLILKGDLFIELYCTRGPRTEATTDWGPVELYDTHDALDLGRMAPGDDEISSLPVWRIAISRVSGALHARKRSGEPLEPADAELERIIWLVNRDPAGHANEDKIYFNRDE
jgi:hypothetical protein